MTIEVINRQTKEVDVISKPAAIETVIKTQSITEVVKRGPQGPPGQGGGGSWGEITGTLSDQADLQTALNAKQPVSIKHTAIEWASLDTTVLASGVFGINTSTGKYKIGDGATQWAALEYESDRWVFIQDPCFMGVVTSVPQNIGFSEVYGIGSGATGDLAGHDGESFFWNGDKLVFMGAMENGFVWLVASVDGEPENLVGIFSGKQHYMATLIDKDNPTLAESWDFMAPSIKCGIHEVIGEETEHFGLGLIWHASMGHWMPVINPVNLSTVKKVLGVEAFVSAFGGGDYEHPQDAFLDGKRKLFVGRGTYNMTQPTYMPNADKGFGLKGEERETTIVDFAGFSQVWAQPLVFNAWDAGGSLSWARGSFEVMCIDFDPNTKGILPGQLVRFGGYAGGQFAFIKNVITDSSSSGRIITETPNLGVNWDTVNYEFVVTKAWLVPFFEEITIKNTDRNARGDAQVAGSGRDTTGSFWIANGDTIIYSDQTNLDTRLIAVGQTITVNANESITTPDNNQFFYDWNYRVKAIYSDRIEIDTPHQGATTTALVPLTGVSIADYIYPIPQKTADSGSQNRLITFGQDPLNGYPVRQAPVRFKIKNVILQSSGSSGVNYSTGGFDWEISGLEERTYKPNDYFSFYIPQGSLVRDSFIYVSGNYIYERSTYLDCKFVSINGDGPGFHTADGAGQCGSTFISIQAIGYTPTWADWGGGDIGNTALGIKDNNGGLLPSYFAGSVIANGIENNGGVISASKTIFTTGTRGVTAIDMVSGGLGYSVDDVLTLPGGDSGATIHVSAVDGSGTITSWELATAGTGYSINTYSPTGGTGHDASFSVTAIDYAPYTPTDSDNVMFLDASSGPIDVTLPTASARAGREFKFIRVDQNSGAVASLIPLGAENIDGLNSTFGVSVSSGQNSTVNKLKIISDNANWWTE